LTVERGGERVEVTLVRAPGEVASQQLRLVLTTRNATFSLPFEVTFRRRQIGGPSGGLIYALALADMLGTRDIARGRTIAATGAIDPAGDVSPVGFVVEKSTAVRRARASQLLVPEDQVVDAARSGRPVHGVLTLGDAVKTLTAPE
jgi:PDZ domain-containing protein